MFSTFVSRFAKAGWAPAEGCKMMTGKCCYQTPTLQMNHIWAKNLGSLYSGFCSETYCKQGIEFYSHCWEIHFLVFSWQFMAIWHHQIVLPLLILHVTFKHFVDLASGLCFSRSCPSISGTVVSSAAPILHPITDLRAVRKKEIRKERKKGGKKSIKKTFMYWNFILAIGKLAKVLQWWAFNL